MKKIFRRKLWMQVVAVVLAMALNLGALDGIIRYTMQEWALGSFAGFLKTAAAKNVEADKNKNVLPQTAGPKKYKDPLAEEARENNEVISKRTTNSKTFKIGEKEYKTEVYQEPIHYANDKKEMVDIDNTLVKSNEKDFAFENRANSLKVRFAAKTGGKTLGLVQRKNSSMKWSLLDSREADGNAADNTITYDGVGDNTGLRYTVDGETLKEEIILNGPGAPAEFKFALNLNNLEVKTQKDGYIDFIEPGSGTVIWTMPKPFMYDAGGEVSREVTANISSEKGKLILSVTADPKWLSEAGRRFPVVIDPTLQPPDDRYGRDTFISSSNSTTNYNSSDRLYVGNTADYSDTRSFFFFRNVTEEENVKVTSATFSVWAKGGNLSAIDLYPCKVDWVWDYKVLTWDYWQKRSAKNQTLDEVADTASGPGEGWWNFDIKDLVQKWVDDPVSNVGFALFPASGAGYKEFVPSNDGTTNDRPKLVYTYTDDAANENPADFKMSMDRKTGSVTVSGTANKAKKQRADLQYLLLSNGGGRGSSGNSGGNNSGNSDNKGNANEKDKSIGSGADKVKNKDLKIEDREAKKEKAKAKNGYRQKGKYTNKGKHLGWYKNGKLPAEKVEITYYLNDVSDPLTQVLMTYGEDGKYDAAYTYGLERIEVEDIDETRPESQDPLYYLYDGLGSATYMVKPDGNMRDHYRYDEYGKPAPGNSKLSEDGRINLNNTFGYTSEMWDEESNLLYLRARYYEPETGRFLSRDSYEGSLRTPLTKNKYIYVQNSPVNLVDHSGKWAEKVHRGLTKDIIDSFVKSYSGTNFGKFLKENKQKIIDHSNDPDGYFRNFIGGYQWADHFYNPETGKNYKKNDILGTAPGRVKQYMTASEEGYNSRKDPVIAGTLAKAIAWALHYLEDMSNPYHTSDKIGGPNRNSDHSDYEDWAETKVNNKTVKVSTNIKTYETIAVELAQKSHNDAKNKWKPDPKYKDEIYLLPHSNYDLNYYFDLAREYGTQLLYSFYDVVE